MKPLRLVALLFAGGLVLATPGARAESADAQRAAEYKKRGDDLLEAKRFEEALAAYDAAYAIQPSAALLYNRGRALQFMARYPEALDAIHAFVREASPELRARVPGIDELVADLEGRVASLTLRCDVAGARVLVGGRLLGVCPFTAPVSVAAGPQAIEAFADGYFPFRRELNLAGKSQYAVDVLLASRDTSALLVVKSRVAATRVTADGQRLGVVPAETGLSAGEHVIRVEHDGYDPASTRVVLRAGERKELTLDPVARPSILTRWWFWAGVGVVAAGAAVTVVALTTEKSAPSGDFSPGSVRF